MAGREQLGRVATVVITNLVTNKKITVEGLRVTFKITKMQSKKKKGNKGRIQIYNLAAGSRKLIETIKDKKDNPQTFVELWVGYEATEPGIIFRGRCDVTSMYKSPEWVTTLSGEDGEAQYKYLFNKTYSKGTPVSTILRDIAEQSGIVKFRLEPMTAKIPKARTFNEPPMMVIDKLQKVYGFTFDIQDEGTIIRANRYKLDSRYEIKMNYETGLLGEPRTQGNLVVIDSLINHNIRPKSFITLKSLKQSDLDGSYCIQKVETEGDSYSGKWNMTTEMVSTATLEKIPTKEA